MASLSFLRFFQVELFLFVFIFSLAVEDVTVTLLAQDKFCMARFNSSDICANLSNLKPSADAELLRAKDEILVQVTTFNFYQSLIYTVPVIFSSMFLSGWADRHKSSTKTLICLTSFMAGLESLVLLTCAVKFESNVNLMLLSFIFFPLVGGSQSLGMAAISYLSSTTASTERVKRFSILELTHIVSHPLGIFIGGLIIRNPRLTYIARTNGQLHNYHQVLFLAAIGKFAAFTYAAVMKFKSRPKFLLEGRYGEGVVVVGGAEVANNEKAPLLSLKNGTKILPQPKTKLQKFLYNSGDLFVWRNIRESVSVCFQRRPGSAHVYIWLLLITMSIVTANNRSVGGLMFQFVQKVYSWDAGTYSTFNSLLFISTHLFGLLIVTPILTKLLRISDSTLLVLGLLSLMSQNFIRGTVISVTAFAVSYGFGSITSIISVAIRTKLSRLAPAHEQNRIFGVLTMLETIAPLAGISLYTAVFNASISVYPGLVFQLSCALLLIPFSIAVYIGVKSVGEGGVVAGGGGSPETADEDAKCATTTLDGSDLNNNCLTESWSSSSLLSSTESKKTVISIY